MMARKYRFGWLAGGLLLAGTSVAADLPACLTRAAGETTRAAGAAGRCHRHQPSGIRDAHETWRNQECGKNNGRADSVAALQRDFGTLRDYQAPKDFHPNSILSPASISRGRRGSQVHGTPIGE